jgi:hypothetical protein
MRVADKQDQILQELHDARREVGESHVPNEQLQSDLQRLLEIVDVLPKHSRQLNSIEARLGGIELQ